MLAGSALCCRPSPAAGVKALHKRLDVRSLRYIRSSALLPSSRQNSRNLYTHSQTRPYTCSLGKHRTSRYIPLTSSYGRFYHSTTDFSSSNSHFSSEQKSILSLALSNYVPKIGFTTESVALAAQDLGYPEVSLQLFPRGAEIELIIYWLSSRRAILKERVEGGEIFSADGTILSVDQKVKRLVVERLKMNTGIIQHWQDALAIMSLPTNISASLHELHELSSDILHLAGDRSVDQSWYSKRLSVSVVYATAEITMTEDKSDDFASTESFVQRRFGDTDAFTGTVGDAKTYLSFLGGSLVAAGRSLGMKI